MSALDTVAQRNPPDRIRIVGRAVMVFLAAFVAWATVAQFEEVAIATGEIVPQGQVKVIQHLEGGIVDAIFVKQGDRVKAGDPLVQLNLEASDNRGLELAVTLDGYVLRRARLLAEASGGTPDFPADLAERRPDAVSSEQRAFDMRQLELQSTLAGLTQQIAQRELDVQQLNTERANTAADLGIAREELAISNALIADGLTSKVDHLTVQAKVQKLEGDIRSLSSAIPRAESALNEAQQKLREAELNFRRTALDELGKVEIALDETEEELTKATDKARRTEINSPIAGVVKSLKFHTIGAVVRPGEPIMEIVPSGENLVVEAKLDPRDVGYVRAGQLAQVKISTYDFVRYGSLDAKVILVSPDSSTTEDGKTYFQVIAQTTKNYLGADETDLPITPGMEATVDIHIGTKSVMHYLLKPVLKLREEAFRER